MYVQASAKDCRSRSLSGFLAPGYLFDSKIQITTQFSSGSAYLLSELSAGKARNIIA